MDDAEPLQTLPGEQAPPNGAFLRFDRRDTAADRHSLAVLLGPAEPLDRVAFVALELFGATRR